MLRCNVFLRRSSTYLSFSHSISHFPTRKCIVTSIGMSRKAWNRSEKRKHLIAVSCLEMALGSISKNGTCTPMHAEPHAHTHTRTESGVIRMKWRSLDPKCAVRKRKQHWGINWLRLWKIICKNNIQAGLSAHYDISSVSAAGSSYFQYLAQRWKGERKKKLYELRGCLFIF